MPPVISYLDYFWPRRRAERRRSEDPGEHADGGVTGCGSSGSATTRDCGCCCCTAGRARPTSTWRPATATCPAAGVEYYYYDQLGSGFSDQPDEPSLWEVDRFVDEVEQVRRALGLDRDNFVLYGQSWGGILAIEYALRYQQHLRGLVISNMMASVPAYNAYAEQVLMPEMDQAALAEIKSLEANGDTENPRYMELLIEQHYVHHVLRMPAGRVARSGAARLRPHQPGDLRVDAGPERARDQRRRQARPLGPDRRAGLDRGADAGHRRAHDTMDPAHMEMMAGRLPKGRYLHCPDGSHLAMYDDQQTYFAGLIDFLIR